jgi:hypothetical protein
VRLLIILLLIISANLACNRATKEPHLIDPIYFEYKRLHDVTVSELDKTQQEIDKIQGQIDKAEPQTGARKAYLESLFELKKTKQSLEEKKSYLADKVEERIKDDKKTYGAAFKDSKPWPDPKEFAAFKLEQSLQKLKGKEWLVERRMRDLLGKKPSVPSVATPEVKKPESGH